MSRPADKENSGYVSRVFRLANKLYQKELLTREYRRIEREYERQGQGWRIDWDWSAINYNRIALLNVLAARKFDGAYLEIGCFQNNLFDSMPIPLKIGVDPVQGGTVRATSDEFFASNTRKFDLIFIDGLHTYDQVRRDLVNALKVINPGGWIALHDMLPRSAMEQHDDLLPIGHPWVGQGWKVAFELLQTQGLDWRIVKIDYGVGVVRVETPGTALADLSSTLSGSTFPYFYENHPRLPIVTWEEALPWLREA
ncbi:class I SAM-dependent methyltransferase [Ancylobacter vacuolatus]|uniref:Class I SAM-dependent methyltransferase n=1 Tax=Ancylobacter vacuolatus TaxID=223389 RepID=A0ABU0DKR8_9HYPH|nr:class I SAM-dependent methyltransferase [Ancylobacter vacuolatus]MDQ0349017.1 hypothetical protein [Ancylobacter vacuolatus]